MRKELQQWRGDARGPGRVLQAEAMAGRRDSWGAGRVLGRGWVGVVESSFLDMLGLGASPSTWRRPAGRWVCDSGVGKAAWTGNVKFREVTRSV